MVPTFLKIGQLTAESIDSELGDSDGWLSHEEAEDFADMVLMERNWSNAYLGGCCLFDYSPMMAVGAPIVVVQPPEIGPVNRTDVFWGGQNQQT